MPCDTPIFWFCSFDIPFSPSRLCPASSSPPSPEIKISAVLIPLCCWTVPPGVCPPCPTPSTASTSWWHMYRQLSLAKDCGPSSFCRLVHSAIIDTPRNKGKGHLLSARMPILWLRLACPRLTLGAELPSGGRDADHDDAHNQRVKPPVGRLRVPAAGWRPDVLGVSVTSESSGQRQFPSFQISVHVGKNISVRYLLAASALIRALPRRSACAQVPVCSAG